MTAALPKIRIIGGRWRRRLIPVLTRDRLRPTPNRVRETLFNWLIPYIEGAHCLDLFAGSGALGIEALSRGAAQVTFVEHDARIAAQLRDTLTTLGAIDAPVHCAEALYFLQQKPASSCEIIFLDPPFHTPYLTETLTILAHAAHQPKLIYIESPRGMALTLPDMYHWHRQDHAGQVGFGLAILK